MDKIQLESAAKCAQEFFKEYSGEGAKTKKYLALKALSSLTLRDLKEGKNALDCQYTVFQILDEMSGFVCDPTDELIRNKVNRYLKNMEEALPTHTAMLNDIAIENKLEYLPGYNFASGRGGGAGNSSTHSFTAIHVIDRKVSVDENQINQGNAITYRLEKIENLPLWAKWLNNFELSGWRLKLIAISAIIIMVIMTVLLLLFLGSMSYMEDGGLIIKSAIAFIFLEIGLFWLIYPLYATGNRRIIAAPMLLLPSKIINGQLESVSTDKIRESTGRNIRKFRLVSYAGTCAICGSRVELEKGGKEFYNRLIGRCLEAPDEHIFSFDRTTRVGYPLRNYYKANR